MNSKVLGIIAILCAPFLYIDFVTSGQNTYSWKSGLFDFIYMTGWLCSLLALRRMEILGKTKWATIAFTIQFCLLTVAQCWNIWVMIGKGTDSILFRIMDMSWPLSNIWMLVIGITAVKVKKMTGWKRFVPLFVGLWFPLTVIPAMTMGIYFLAGYYSVIAFALLGFVVFDAGRTEQRTETNLAIA